MAAMAAAGCGKVTGHGEEDAERSAARSFQPVAVAGCGARVARGTRARARVVWRPPLHLGCISILPLLALAAATLRPSSQARTAERAPLSERAHALRLRSPPAALPTPPPSALSGAGWRGGSAADADGASRHFAGRLGWNGSAGLAQLGWLSWAGRRGWCAQLDCKARMVRSCSSLRRSSRSVSSRVLRSLGKGRGGG